MTLNEAIEKVKKLTRLGKSSNVHEAALAMANAQKIIDRFKLDVNDIDFDDRTAKEDAEPIVDFGYEDPLDKTDYLKAWMMRLASMTARHFQCNIVYVKVDSYGDGKDRGAVIRIIGRPSDVSAARYMHAYFKSEVLRLRDENCVGHSGTYKRQFCLGVVDAIWNKLYESQKHVVEEMRKASGADKLALVRVNNAVARLERRSDEVTKWIQQNVFGGEEAKGRSHGRTNTFVGDAARAHGREVGKSVNVNSRARGSLGAGHKEIGE